MGAARIILQFAGIGIRELRRANALRCSQSLAKVPLTINEGLPRVYSSTFFPKASAAYWREPSGNGEDPRIARNEAFMCWCGRPLIPTV